MAFEGDLSNLGLGDVLQAIAMSRQVGTFVLRGEDERRLACGPQGVALLSSKKSLGLKIGTVLVGTGKITQAHLDQSLKIQSRRKDMMLGQILVDSGACGGDDLRTARRYLAAEEIFALFLWKEGQFEFFSGDPEMSGPFADLWFDVSSLAMEAARRIDEMPRLVGTVPQGEVFVADDHPTPKREELLENRDLACLYHLADGSRTVHDILEDHYRGRFDTLKGMQTLVESGLVRPATKDEVVQAGRAAAAKREFPRAARLFQRASLHDPEDDAIRHSIADALRDSGEKRQAAEELVRIGGSRLAAGKGLPAIESFRAALRLDSGNAAAHEGLTHALAETGLVDEAAEAAQAAARLRISNGDYEGARRVAEAGLAQRQGDPQLLVSLANSLHGLGRTAEGVKFLDQALASIDKTEGDDRRVLDVCRRIVQLDPERKDCLKRIAEIQAFEATRKKRLMQRIAIAAGVLVLVGAAVPLFRRPSASVRLNQARTLLDAKNAEEARAILATIDDSSLDEDETITKRGLDTKVAMLLHAPEDATFCRAFTDKIDGLYRAAVDAIVEEHLDKGLASLIEMLDCLQSADAHKVEKIDAKFFLKVKADAAHDVQTALGNAAAASQAVATRINGVRDRFTEDVWKREDLDIMHDLISQSDRVLESTKPENWDPVPELVTQLVQRTKAPKDASDRTTSNASAAISDAHKQVSRDHDRALARARRKELKEGYKAAYANGTQLEREGRLEDSLGFYEKFLTQCDELRKATPEALYAPIVTELFGDAMQLDQRIRARRDRLSAIVRDCDEAQRAETADEIEDAFRIRKHLVHDNPDLDLSNRFQMPLRIETAPPGAEVFLDDGTPAGHPLGKTPLVTTYPVLGGAKYHVRLAGYRTFDVVRKGASDDTSGIERAEPAKIATWSSKPAGMTESAPTAAPGSILTAGRSGVIRRIDAKTGDELARFEPGLLDGFAGSAVLRGDHAYAVALDGKGYVLNATTLALEAPFDSGICRGSPLPTSRGVLVADETGTVRMIDERGKATWTRTIGRVKCDPAAAGDRAVIVTADAELVLVDLATGDVVRRRQLKSELIWGPPTVRGNRVFLGNEAGEVVCLDAASLEEAWMQRLDGPVRGRVCATDLRIVACTANGAIYMLDVETSAVLSKSLVGGKIDDGACDLPDGGFIAVTKKGNVTRFDAKAQMVWKFDAGEDVTAPPRFIDGAVVIVTRKGTVISLAP